MSVDEQYQIALNIATKAHLGQVDKSGKPYIDHPKRVAARCHGKLKVVAILHDVIEDTDVTDFDLLQSGIDSDIVSLIQCLTRDKDKEEYFEYIHRIMLNPEAKLVKIADIHDNMRPGCPPSLYQRYQKALKMLQ